MARRKARDGFEKAEWEKRFYSKVKEEMNVFNLENADVAKVIGVAEDTFSIKLNDPSKFTYEEFCVLCDFLKVERSDLIGIRPKGFRRQKKEEEKK